MQYYKMLCANGKTPQQGFQWPEPGVWLPEINGTLKLCVNGYHVLRPPPAHRDFLEWVGEELWRVEIDSEVIADKDKCVVRRVRRIERVETWNNRNLRHFAADCAGRVLHLWEQEHPDDMRPRLALRAARAFADGEITSEKMSAARNASASAAQSAAWGVAESAAESAAWSAAASAAWSASASAGWSAAESAAWIAEIKWQIERLNHYLRLED